MYTYSILNIFKIKMIISNHFGDFEGPLQTEETVKQIFNIRRHTSYHRLLEIITFSVTRSLLIRYNRYGT